MATITAHDLRNDAPSADKRLTWLRQLLPPMLVAMAIRLIVVFFYYRQLPDADQYYEQFGWEVGWVARALVSGHGFSSPVWPITGPTAMVPPLYTFLLAGIFKLFGIYTLTSGFIILSLNSLFSSLNCIAVYFSAKHSLGLKGAKIAAWVWALYPFAIYFSADRVWEYALTSLLFTTCFCIAQRIHRWESWLAWAGFGALYGLNAHSNPSVLSTFPFLLALALWQVRKSGTRWLQKGALSVTALVVVMIPWTVRNYRAMHVLCPVRDDYAINIYAGNYDNMSPINPPSNPAAHPPSNPVEMQKFLALGETAYLKEKHDLAIDWIRNHPGDFVHCIRRRAVYFWTGYWSFRPEYLQIEPTEVPMMFYVCGVTVLVFLGVRQLWRSNRTALLPYLVMIGVFPLTYYLSLVLMDYRQAIEPAMVVLGVAGALSFKRKRSAIPNGVS